MREGLANVSLMRMVPVAPWLRAVLIGWGLACCGCSSAGYDREYAERLRAYGSAAEFAALKPEATSVAGGRLAIRLPKELVDQVDDQKEASPGFLRDLPGFATAYRGRRTVGTTQFPVMLVVGMVPTAERRREEVRQAILEQVRTDESFRKAAWGRQQQVTDATGEQRTWDVLTLAGEQPFELVDNGSPVEKRRPGITEVWVSAEPKQKACIILAWRVPEEVAAAVKLDTLAPLTARSAKLPD